ncbi:unnamed protein product [Heterobilharzia americana]|nr:unnamed protein product [Heterobilharzia americana]
MKRLYHQKNSLKPYKNKKVSNYKVSLKRSKYNQNYYIPTYMNRRNLQSGHFRSSTNRHNRKRLNHRILKGINYKYVKSNYDIISYQSKKGKLNQYFDQKVNYKTLMPTDNNQWYRKYQTKEYKNYKDKNNYNKINYNQLKSSKERIPIDKPKLGKTLYKSNSKSFYAKKQNYSYDIPKKNDYTLRKRIPIPDKPLLTYTEPKHEKIHMNKQEANEESRKKYKISNHQIVNQPKKKSIDKKSVAKKVKNNNKSKKLKSKKKVNSHNAEDLKGTKKDRVNIIKVVNEY